MHLLPSKHDRQHLRGMAPTTACHIGTSVSPPPPPPLSKACACRPEQPRLCPPPPPLLLSQACAAAPHLEPPLQLPVQPGLLVLQQPLRPAVLVVRQAGHLRRGAQHALRAGGAEAAALQGRLPPRRLGRAGRAAACFWGVRPFRGCRHRCGRPVVRYCTQTSERGICKGAQAQAAARRPGRLPPPPHPAKQRLPACDSVKYLLILLLLVNTLFATHPPTHPRPPATPCTGAWPASPSCAGWPCAGCPGGTGRRHPRCTAAWLCSAGRRVTGRAKGAGRAQRAGSERAGRRCRLLRSAR